MQKQQRYFPETEEGRFAPGTLDGPEPEDVAALEDELADGAMGGGEALPQKALRSRRRTFMLASAGLAFGVLGVTCFMRGGNDRPGPKPVAGAKGPKQEDSVATARIAGQMPTKEQARRQLPNDTNPLSASKTPTRLGGIETPPENFLDPQELQREAQRAALARQRGGTAQGPGTTGGDLAAQGGGGTGGAAGTGADGMPGFVDPNDPLGGTIVMAGSGAQGAAGAPGAAGTAGTAGAAAPGGTGAGGPSGAGSAGTAAGGGAGTAGEDGIIPGMPASGTGDAPRSVQVGVKGFSPAEEERQGRLDREREEARADSLRAVAQEKRRKSEEQRLRQQATLIASNAEALQRAVAGGGVSRLGLEGPAAPEAVAVGGPAGAQGGGGTVAVGAGAPTRGAGAAGGPGAGAGVANGARARGFDVVPGERVTAEVLNEFVSDANGAGPVSVRLTTPLRLRSGRVLLPAGTIGWGEAAGSAVQPGRPSAVQMRFDTWVLPDRTVMTAQMGIPQGRGVDPKTLALAVPAKADFRFLNRALRGITSSAVELAVTSRTQQNRRSVFEQLTPYEMAVNRTAQRLSNMLDQPVGDENVVRPALRVPRGTRVEILFLQ